jgi:alternate signal-mediated exported protein
MKKTLKGAVAASAAAVLLLGGAGSLAYWSDTASVPGGTFDSGTLALTTDADNPGCSDWTLDSAGGGGTFTPGTTLLVPGDVVTETCTFTLEATGAHMNGTVSATAPDATGDLASALTVTASNITLDGTPATNFTEANNGQTLEVDVSVTFNSGSDNSTQNLSAVLDDITVTAQQTHP